jgi:hypothetical protein
MAQQKNQKIAVNLTMGIGDDNLIMAGVQLPRIFGKQLHLLHILPKNRPAKNAGYDLEKIATLVSGRINDVNVTCEVMPNPGRNLSRVLSDDLEVIIFITGSRQFKKVAHALRSSPVPFLFVSEQEEFTSDFSKVVIPVDMRRQNEDSLLWSLFFGRNARSHVIAIGANDKSKEGKKNVASHLNSAKRLFTKAGVSHNIYRGSKGSLSIQNEAFDSSEKLGANLYILLGSSYVTWLDLIIGLPEQKIIEKAGNLPVLVVNPRRETYLVCE